MKLQLIVTILGLNRPGILSTVAECVAEAGCNILDSRQAIMGKDFSLTMIIEGKQTAITKAEIMIPQLSQQHDLLSMLKRTSEHCKQNIEHLCSLEFSGADSLGIVKAVTAVFAEFEVSVTALRQQTYVNAANGTNMMRCKMMLSAPEHANLNLLRLSLDRTLESLGLQGKFVDKLTQD